MKRGIVGPLVPLALVLAGLGALAGRVVLEGRSALAEGDDSMLRGHRDEAIAAYERAARWYLPVAPHVDAAYDRLRELTRDPATELAAARAIRGAALATRSLWTPHAADLAAANLVISRASARDPRAGAGAGDTTATRESWYLGRLERETGPSAAAAALAIFGIAGWVFGAIALARRGIDPAGKLVRRPALMSVTAIVLGVLCWAVGLYNA
ncbi:MAG: hypothetical protein JWO36_5713 [Myxococcales bacterium]|nr:hypothetical protein [Myxococcales bacterium]